MRICTGSMGSLASRRHEHGVAASSPQITPAACKPRLFTLNCATVRLQGYVARLTSTGARSKLVAAMNGCGRSRASVAR